MNNAHIVPQLFDGISAFFLVVIAKILVSCVLHLLFAGTHFCLSESSLSAGPLIGTIGVGNAVSQN